MINLQTAEAAPREGLVDFGLGQPGYSVLPVSTIREATKQAFEQLNPELLNYGVAEGDGYFRVALANFLTSHYEAEVSYEGLMVTSGNSQATDLLCTYLTQNGDTIFVEEPSYFLAFDIFKDHGLNIVGIPMEADGIDIVALEKALEEHKPAFLYTIPVFHNPTGITMSEEKRQKLVELAELHGFYILADEVYQLLFYTDTKPPLPFACLSDSDRIISMGSFSKILAPGLRLGWLHANSDMIKKISACGFIASSGSVNHLMTGIVKSVIDLGLQDRYLTSLKQTYYMRSQLMENMLRDKMPDSVYWYTPSGGFFFWLTLDKGVDTGAHLDLADRLDIGYVPGVKFSSRNGQRNNLRLCFTFFDELELTAGLNRFTDFIYRIV